MTININIFEDNIIIKTYFFKLDLNNSSFNLKIKKKFLVIIFF